MKKKFITKMGIVALALMCIVCSYFCTAVCSAEGTTYTITYVDTEGNAIAANAVAREGYTATADIYEVEVCTYTPADPKDEDDAQSLEVEAEASDAVIIEFNNVQYTITLIEDSGSVYGIFVYDYSDNSAHYLIDDAAEHANSITTYSYIVQLIVDNGELTISGSYNHAPSFSYAEVPATVPAIKIVSVAGAKLGSETKIATAVDILNYVPTKAVKAVVTYTKKAAPVVDPTPTIEDTEEPEEVDPEVELEGWDKFKADCEANWNKFIDFFKVDIPNFFTVTLKEFFTVTVKDFFTVTIPGWFSKGE